MAKFPYYALVFLYVFTVEYSSASKCIKQNPCSCTIDDYTFINLSQVRPSEGAFFQDSKEDVSYFFSGCEDKKFNPQDYKLIFNETNLPPASLIKCCSSIVIDHDNKTTSTTTLPPDTQKVNQTCRTIGFAKDMKYDLVAGSTTEYQIIYANSNESFPSIRLACDSFNSTDLKIFRSDTNALTLYSPLVCVQHIEHHHLSTGSTFCVILFLTAFIYFVGGGLIMYFVRGARGAEIIPNFDFWSSLPGLIKDGLVFLLSGCRPYTVSTAETYDRI